LAQVPAHGYAESAGETVHGAASVAAPVRMPGGDVVAALSVAGPAARFGDDAVRRHAAMLIEATGRIARDLHAAQVTGAAVGFTSGSSSA
ncbi:MAG TPA: IclR family transcriptional regulator C-terminal domain-containing protein, partial [Ktedonobacterales bacterium]|nr:IclR family transcriptional regulator C-terminal domain-containing protein [Ktedonobacterales bacterium]